MSNCFAIQQLLQLSCYCSRSVETSCMDIIILDNSIISICLTHYKILINTYVNIDCLLPQYGYYTPAKGTAPMTFNNHYFNWSVVTFCANTGRVLLEQTTCSLHRIIKCDYKRSLVTHCDHTDHVLQRDILRTLQDLLQCDLWTIILILLFICY